MENKYERFGLLWYWAFDSAEFSPTEKLVFAALCLLQDRANYCRPSVAELARLSSFCKKTVFNALKSLENKGAIKRTNRFDKNGKTSNLYHLAMSVRATVARTEAG